ncbi:MAG: hypothetical protein M1814_000541 [Vezdaea aestivalis]|nr:MAG: hypothetical protein M1814_000541 [Vezdaea aestivalis]
MSAPERPARAGRPMLRHGSTTGGSFIQDLQQYRPPVSTSTDSGGIDSVLSDHAEAMAINDGSKGPSAGHTAPNGTKRQSPSRIKDSGIVHTMSHRNCQPGPDDAPKLVATLFYKSQNPCHPNSHPDTVSSSSPTIASNSPGSLPLPEVPLGSAPTQDMNTYPLEPPPPEPEPLDHLYGSYITQVCLMHFLQGLEELQKPYERTTSSHRCLDAQAQPRVMDVSFSPAPSEEYISFEELRRHESIWGFERQWNVEVLLQRDNVWRKAKRLVVFDMDSTLIQQEVIDEIAKAIGVEDKVSAITARAMNGELDFSASLKERVALLKGVPATIFETLKSQITLTLGAKELCKALRQLGCKTAVVSGGFTPLAEWLAAQLDLDYAFANNLDVSADGTELAGTVTGDIVDGARKAALLEAMAEKERIPLKQVVAIGDGANDLPMMMKAGLGIAFNAKPKVQLAAPTRLNSASLMDVLYVMGYTKEEQDELIG